MNGLLESVVRGRRRGAGVKDVFTDDKHRLLCTDGRGVIKRRAEDIDMVVGEGEAKSTKTR
jgi:hypothetical protein